MQVNHENNTTYFSRHSALANQGKHHDTYKQPGPCVFVFMV
jgi:hypothetical protein